MHSERVRLQRPDSNKRASGKAGAVHCLSCSPGVMLRILLDFIDWRSFPHCFVGRLSSLGSIGPVVLVRAEVRSGGPSDCSRC
jgi:hypothetical protein